MASIKRVETVPRERLHKILDNLVEELDATEALNADDREKLRGVVHQIREAVGDAGEIEDQSLLDSLDDAALHFETEHPRLTGTLYRISELLRSAGLS